MIRRAVRPLAIVAATIAGGCASEAPRRTDPAFAAPSGLTATLAGPGHIELRWQDNATREAGYFVEYTSSPEDAFVLLSAVPRNATMALHPDLAPETRFIYRVTPFFGEASGAASITTGRPGGDGAPAAFAEPPPGPSGPHSLRDPSRARAAAATALTATLVGPVRVELRWQDRSRDEEGYLVEGTRGLEDFRVFAYVPPNATSYVVDGLPAQTECHFRVRAFYRGEPSPTAERTTGRRTS